MKQYKFYVITHTSDLLEKGNTCHSFLWDGYDFSNEEKITYAGESNIGKPIGECKVAVFEEGEIVICDANYEREVCYPGRKPCKWDVVYEVFDNLDDAVAKAKEIVQKIWEKK